jgi:hypothetical protein
LNAVLGGGHGAVQQRVEGNALVFKVRQFGGVEQVGDEPVDALPVAVDHLQHEGGFGVNAAPQVAAHLVGRQQHVGERIAHLVGNGAGNPAGGSQFFGLQQFAQFGVGPLKFRNPSVQGGHIRFHG